ncbi:MAG: hypothetical protein CMB29_05765 [Euryarchaeota archaeon]|nr:hypothetical protein [Euryarchaeota archaeon]
MDLNNLDFQNFSEPFLLILELKNYLSKKRKRQSLVLFLFIFFSALLESVSISLFLPFVQIVTNPVKNQFNFLEKTKFIFNNISDNQIIITYGVIFIFLVITSIIIKILNLWLINKFVALMSSDLAIIAYKKTINQPYEIHIKRNSSEVISTIITETDFCVSAFNSFLLFINALIMSFFIIMTLLIINPTISFILFLFLVTIYATISYFSNKILVSNGKKISIGVKKQLKALREGIGEIKEILLSYNQDFYINRYRNIDSVLRMNVSTNKFIGAYPRFIVEGILLLSLAIALIFLRIYSDSFNLYLPFMLTVGVGIQKLLPMMQQAYLNYAQIKSTTASLSSLLSLIKQPVNKESNIYKNNVFKDKIVFKNVGFHYTKDNRKILKNISFEIFKGEKIGIKGKTGSGKTTLIDLLMGLLSPTEGYILIDNKDLNSEKNKILMKSWRKSLSHIPQNPLLIDSTIKENIALGVPISEIDEGRLKKAAKCADIYDFIENLKYKYNSNVGEQGIKFSGGQKQRIAIARAFYKKSKILILDEHTSSLDIETEKRITNNLNFHFKDLTIIVIAHRLETLKMCDRVFEFKNGNLIKIENNNLMNS